MSNVEMRSFLRLPSQHFENNGTSMTQSGHLHGLFQLNDVQFTMYCPKINAKHFEVLITYQPSDHLPLCGWVLSYKLSFWVFCRFFQIKISVNSLQFLYSLYKLCTNPPFEPNDLVFFEKKMFISLWKFHFCFRWFADLT